jgi:hypothetical protein
MKPKVFEVVAEGARWKVVEQQRGSCISLHATREMAINDGRRAANANHPSRLIIRNADGAVEREQAYGDQDLASSA